MGEEEADPRKADVSHIEAVIKLLDPGGAYCLTPASKLAVPTNGEDDPLRDVFTRSVALGVLLTKRDALLAKIVHGEPAKADDNYLLECLRTSPVPLRTVELTLAWMRARSWPSNDIGEVRAAMDIVKRHLSKLRRKRLIGVRGHKGRTCWVVLETGTKV